MRDNEFEELRKKVDKSLTFLDNIECKDKASVAKVYVLLDELCDKYIAAEKDYEKVERKLWEMNAYFGK